jgi:hypothetical protein
MLPLRNSTSAVLLRSLDFALRWSESTQSKMVGQFHKVGAVRKKKRAFPARLGMSHKRR